MIDTSNTKRFWDSVAEKSALSDLTSVGMLTEGNEFNARYRREEEEKHFLRIANPKKSAKVLEVGSGGGRWAFFLSDKVADVIGIDFSEQMVQLAEKQRIERSINNVYFIKSDLLGYNCNEKFDIIYFSGILQYINDHEIVLTLKKAKEFLVPGGLVVSRDTIQSGRRITMDGDYPVIYRTIEEYEALFQEAGYRLEYCELSYQPRRFSHFCAKLCKLPFMTYERAFAIQSILISVNNFLGSPRFLMKKHYRDMLDQAGEREHRFFRYRTE